MAETAREVISVAGREVAISNPGKVLFPKPGHYRFWLQFQRQGKLSTIPFTVRVLRSGETTTQH